MKKAFAIGVLAVVVMCMSGTAFSYSGPRVICMYYIESGFYTPGDMRGFPLTISEPGSYMLMENIIVPNANTMAIEVTADNVTIDLNGFSIIGPVVCTASGSPATVACVPSGIDTSPCIYTLRDALTVKNGTITGCGGSGVFTWGSAIIENIYAKGNRGDGINVAHGGGTAKAIVRNTVASSNYFGGIYVGCGLITGNTSSHNGLDGIVLQTHGLVSGNVATGNHNQGFNLSAAIAQVSDNVAYSNGGAGIYVNTGIVKGNVSSNNTGYGFDLTDGVGYINNSSSGVGGLFHNGNPLGDNICNTALCP